MLGTSHLPKKKSENIDFWASYSKIKFHPTVDKTTNHTKVD